MLSEEENDPNQQYDAMGGTAPGTVEKELEAQEGGNDEVFLRLH